MEERESWWIEIGFPQASAVMKMVTLEPELLMGALIRIEIPDDERDISKVIISSITGFSARHRAGQDVYRAVFIFLENGDQILLSDKKMKIEILCGSVLMKKLSEYMLE